MGKEFEKKRKEKRRTNCKILIVDDSQDILDLVSNILSLESFISIPVNSAKKALEIMDKTYDAVILDLMMPEMDGIEFLKEFRSKKEFRHTPVIVLTAKNNSEEEIAALFKLGANDYITKPFLKDEFTSRIRVHANLKRNTESLYLTNRKLHSRFTELQKAVKREEVLNEKILERTIELKEANEKIADLNKALEYSATHDVLTETLNRGALLSYLENDIKRAKRLKSSLSLIMFDVDYFKKVNDTYGHLVGDSVLRQLAIIIKDVIRDIDLFGRYGGEEFIIILPDTNLEQALVLANRLLLKVRASNFLTNKINLRITISIGLTEYKPEDSIDLFIERSDEAMYEAKKSGRNCLKYK